MEQSSKAKQVPWTAPQPPDSPAAEAIPPSPQVAADLALLDYWLTVERWWWLIILATAVSWVGANFYTRYRLPKLYRATAILRPEQTEMPLAAALGGTLSAELGYFGFDMGSSRAEKLISILKSFEFTTAMIKKYNLEGPPTKPGDRGPTPWQLYEKFSGPLDCSFATNTGNLTLTYTGTDRALIVKTLGFYVQTLRDELRRREVENAAAAVNSLRDEAMQTSDAMLQKELYELIAKQVERQKLAEVETSIGFTIIEAPVVPDEPYGPSVRKNCLSSAGFTFFALVALAFGYDRGSRVLRRVTALRRSLTPKGRRRYG